MRRERVDVTSSFFLLGWDSGGKECVETVEWVREDTAAVLIGACREHVGCDLIPEEGVLDFVVAG